MTIPFSENGGFAATQYFIFVPVSAPTGIYIGIWDVTSLDDPNDGSSYFYRQEEIQTGRFPTVRRVFLVYRDLGVATITVGIRAIDDNDALVQKTTTVQLGTTAATGNLLSQFVDITVAGFRPQLFIQRAAGAGPLDIVKAVMIGESDEVSL